MFEDTANVIQTSYLSPWKTVDLRPVKLRWYYQMGKMPVLQYGYIVTDSHGSHLEWANVEIEYEPGYIKVL